MAEFQSESLQLAAFVVSVYILGFAAGPLVIAPLSEIYGRVVVYHVCNVGFTVGVVGCALAPSIEALIVFRFISGTFGSCPATIGAGSIADMVPQERRAAVMAGYTVGALFAPILGPIIGGFLTDALGWRSNFWFLTIVDAFIVIMMMITLKETYHPVLLERKTSRLREETGNKLLRSKLDAGLSPGAYFMRNIIRPLRMLTASPTVIIMSLFVAITYGYMCKCPDILSAAMQAANMPRLAVHLLYPGVQAVLRLQYQDDGRRVPRPRSRLLHRRRHL